MDRANTNKVVFEKANTIKNPRNKPNKNIFTYGQRILQTQQKLLTHIARANTLHPMRQCTLEPNTIYPSDVNNRRVGRPRKRWADNTYERLAHKDIVFDHNRWKREHKYLIDLMEQQITNRTINIQGFHNSVLSFEF